MEMTVPDLLTGYESVVKAVLANGRPKSPRGLRTYDVPSATIIVQDPTRCLPVGTGRKLSTKLAAVEALSLIGGFCDPALLIRAAPNMEKYSEGGNFHGGYGIRVRGQLPIAIERLLLDPDTRQAQIVLWDPSYDALVSDARDYPCTTSLQFFITDGKLEMHSHMRSNDVWRGLSLDAFMFTQLQLAVAGLIGLDVGPYYHHASSLHIYESDVEAAAMLHAPTRDFSLAGLYRSTAFSRGEYVPPTWKQLARVVRDHVRVGNSDELHPVDFNVDVLQWYLREIRSCS